MAKRHKVNNLESRTIERIAVKQCKAVRHHSVKLSAADLRILAVSSEARATLLENHRWIDEEIRGNARKMAAKLRQLAMVLNSATEARQ